MLAQADLTRIPPPRGRIEPIFSPGPALANQNPSGVRLQADRHSLLLDERRWMPVMGEMQFSRCNPEFWRDGLLKMKAAGIDIVATYIFWLHHEEIEGEFDFGGQRDLGEFVRLCHELGLYLQLRIGPWVHGECRNGGFPDWLMRKGYMSTVPAEAKNKQRAQKSDGLALRSNDPDYLRLVQRFFQQIARQVTGHFWKDGGRIIGIQLENEYEGPAEHLITLKHLAREAGLDAPLFYRTGWPSLTTEMPFGEMLPLYGCYAEGMWDRNIEMMPHGYWEGFTFKPHRIDATIATDHFGVREEKDESNTQRYPYLTCELGGGMLQSYHRRVRIFPEDVACQAMLKLGSGNSLPGYYVFHGGTNPEGKLTSLNESQASGYPNDLPVKSYDEIAPLGEFGQPRPHYHMLRRLHLFIRDFGVDLAAMTSLFPAAFPSGKTDTETLRWCVRSDGNSAYLFVNNYQRLQPMPAKRDVQFSLQTRKGEITLPREPAVLPADNFFFWPVHIDMGGVLLVYATAQPVCHLDVGNARYAIFSKTEGVTPEFVFESSSEISSSAAVQERDGRKHVEKISASRNVILTAKGSAGRQIHFIVLDEKDSLACWKIEIEGQPYLALSPDMVLTDNDKLRCQVFPGGETSIALLPRPQHLEVNGEAVEPSPDGAFFRYAFSEATPEPEPVLLEMAQKAAPAREIKIGPYGVAQAPPEGEFDHAAIWRVKIPPSSGNEWLRVYYQGDVARYYLNGRLLTDDFYHGRAFDLGLDWFGPEISTGELLIKILPLRKNAPIYLQPGDWPDAVDEKGIAQVIRAERIRIREQVLTFSSNA